MLLVLGRPGSGCTSLLKALAGDTHGISIGPGSIVNYHGISHRQMHADFKGESIYLAELDVHLPELTVEQTLIFAALTREQGADRQSVSRITGRRVAQMLDLGNTLDTRVGSTTTRGVSGGEKRRTSIAEAIVGGASLQCWDNSTRGLDSATAQRVVGLLRESTTVLKTTVAMSVYQASEIMYKSFDKVTVLYQGRQIYFGPVQSAPDYFCSLGFVRPDRATTPDFLTSLTNPSERIARPGFEHRVPRSPDDFATAWKRSAQAKALHAEIDAFEAAYPILETDEKLSRRTSTYAISLHLQVLVCLGRGFQRLRNDPAAAISLAAANAVLALLLGSVFYKLPVTADSMDRRSVIIFFSLMLTAFTPAFEVLAIWAQRPIVEKHSRYALYHPSADAVASMICDLPSKLATAALFQTTIYFITNLRQTPAAFFTWLLFNFVLMLAMSVWFRLLGSIARKREHTMAPSGIIILLCVIYIGFVVPVPYMVGWLAWFRRVNPIAYAYESLMINEFRNRQFPCSSTIPTGPAYTAEGLDGKVCPHIGAVARQDFIEGSAYLLDKYRYEPGHLWRNLGILLGMVGIVCALHLAAAEYIPAQRSKGDLLRFRSGQVREKKGSDLETNSAVTFAQDLGSGIGQDSRGEGNASDKAIRKPLSVFHWTNLCYDVKIPQGTKRILNGIDGWVKPGTLTALMGVTGAGKTTLLDVLAHRGASGAASGQVYIDSHLRDASFQRKIGYVQQEDIHVPTSTVREALEFSALLRQTGSCAAKKREYVDRVIDVLDMAAYADAVVGVAGDGLNIEQRKRLTIGVELVAKPELLLFLDEPTSGMDSQTAWSICTLLRKLADSGQSVLCTIHQPSAQLFCMFDRLLLLDSRGETIYFGDIGLDASSVLGYFESHGAPKCPPDANPAEWVLEVTGSDEPGKGKESWSQKWQSSPQKLEVVQHLSGLRAVANTSEVARTHADEYAASWFRQLAAVSTRLFQEYWRDPAYLSTKVALCAGMALLNGLSFQNTRLDIQGLTNVLFSIFLVSQLFATLNQQIILRFADGMALYEARERRSKSYSWSVFVAANLAVEIVWQTVAAVLVFTAWYYPTGLWRNGDTAFGTADRGALSFVLVWLFCLWVTTLSQALASGIKHPEVAIQISTLCYWFSLVFCGVLATPSSLPGFWLFMNRASPLTYFVDGLAIAGLANAQVTCSAVEMLHIELPSSSKLSGTCGDYLGPYIRAAGGYLSDPGATRDCQYCRINDANSFLRALDIETDGNPWRNAGFLAVYVVFDAVAVFALYWLVRVLPR
ncbi:ABC-2 type transporter [Hirsutella rhossiliensis]|uniref:ABC-2 type transporter domain-containing protein n=1 Tax=Hirsutella rhossiliensis TaxID=111463 RepID=A0A9P8SMD0_9HYPO|nr:ABC-2 type transporter domain-containing protein [Hirsutella rhossiliensis]KAH0967876.1 ABC-2 type transporter domain-containing protein [Hirsutella rhossiliensis]